MTQVWNADQYVDNASFVAELGNPVVSLLGPKKFERILDLGCGDGTLTKELEKSCAYVHGVDFSESMVTKAIGRGLSAEVCNGEALTFNNEFDAVFTNAALHWMKNYDGVIQGVAKALKSQGRFVGEFGGYGNINTLVKAMKTVFANNTEFGEFINPWFFPDIETYCSALERGGFNVESMELIDRPTPLATGVKEWLKLFAVGITKNLDAKQMEIFLDETIDIVKPQLYSLDKGWVADYVRLRFSARKT